MSITKKRDLIITVFGVLFILYLLFQGGLIGYRIYLPRDTEASGWIGNIEYKINVSVVEEDSWNYLRVIHTIKNHGRETYGKSMGWGPFSLRVYTMNGWEMQRLEPRTRLLTIIELSLKPGEEYVFEYNTERFRVLVPGAFTITGVWTTVDGYELETSKIRINTSYCLCR